MTQFESLLPDFRLIVPLRVRPSEKYLRDDFILSYACYRQQRASVLVFPNTCTHRLAAQECREEDGEVEREELKVAVKGVVEEGRKLRPPPMEVLMCFYFYFGDEREGREEVLVVEE